MQSHGFDSFYQLCSSELPVGSAAMQAALENAGKFGLPDVEEA
ncbi:MAG TPA: hypothetical protein V6C57_07090 [Coleofasciculaceae cyanobacterium]